MLSLSLSSERDSDMTKVEYTRTHNIQGVLRFMSKLNLIKPSSHPLLVIR